MFVKMTNNESVDFIRIHFFQMYEFKSAKKHGQLISHLLDKPSTQINVLSKTFIPIFEESKVTTKNL